MIKGINSSGKYISVMGGTSSDPYISPGSAGAGMLRWNSNMNMIEVNDGMSWKNLNMTYATVALTPDAESLLDWARKKREAELELHNLSKTHPAIKNALDALSRAQEQVDLVYKLSKDHEYDLGEVESNP
jgi:hypothetical protein